MAAVVFSACAGQRYAADAETCLIDRPYSADVVRTQRDERRSFGTGITEFEVEFVLDRYLPGECRWHPHAIQMSVNRPP
jgi:hypothetical protein